MKRIIQKTLLGIAWGFTILVLVQTVGILTNKDFFGASYASDYLKYVFCSAITGIGFTLPTIVYDSDKFSRGMQFLIHLGTGFIVYFPIALYAGWIPIAYGFGAVATFILFTIAISLFIWFCFFLFYRSEAKKINKKIREKQKP